LAFERLEGRWVPSKSFEVPTHSFMTDEGPQLVAVGKYDSGSTMLPFLAVTYVTYRNGHLFDGGVDVLLSDGKGGFATHKYSLGPGASPEGIVVGRFMGSTYDDLAVADNNGPVYIFRGKGNGDFEQVDPSPIPAPPTPASPSYLATAKIGEAPYLF